LLSERKQVNPCVFKVSKVLLDCRRTLGRKTFLHSFL